MCPAHGYSIYCLIQGNIYFGPLVTCCMSLICEQFKRVISLPQIVRFATHTVYCKTDILQHFSLYHLSYKCLLYMVYTISERHLLYTVQQIFFSYCVLYILILYSLFLILSALAKEFHCIDSYCSYTGCQ